MNYLSAIKDTLDENGPTVPANVNEIGSVVYHDVQARYEFGADREYAVYAGADNVFDKKPPVLGQDAAVGDHRHRDGRRHVRPVRSHVVRGRGGDVLEHPFRVWPKCGGANLRRTFPLSSRL